MTCPTTPLGRSECARELAERSAAMGVEITVSTAPPIVIGPYTVDPFICPHGVRYWIEPTGEQIASLRARRGEPHA